MTPNNPFKNCAIVSADTSVPLYYGSKVARGDFEFVMSRTQLVWFSRCPQAWRAGYQMKPTSEMNSGSLIDCLLLTPQLFDQKYVLCPETYPCEPTKKDPRVAKPWTWSADFCKVWRDEQLAFGKMPVKRDDVEAAQIAVRRVENDTEAKILLHQSRRQVFVDGLYADAATGLDIPVQCLIDLAPENNPWPNANRGEFADCLADFKTTESASPRAWRRSIVRYRYHWQAAIYLDLYNAATGDQRNSFLHLLLENYPPFTVGRRYLTDDFLQLGRAQYRRTLANYAQCLATNKWPDYEAAGRDLWRGAWAKVEPEPWMFSEVEEFEEV